MKKLLALFLSLLLWGHVYVQDSIEKLIVDYLEVYQVPGAVVGVVKDDSLHQLSAYGVADVQNGANVITKTSFELGSLTKQFTAAAILKLQQDHKINVEDYLYTHFPECPEHWRSIKIKHLIWHTSGLPGMFPHDAFQQKSFTGYAKMETSELDKMMQTNLVTKANSIRSIISDSLDFEPGTKYNYSDVGYLLLGIVIDNVTGSYRDYMKDAIFDVANLKNTYLLNQENVVYNQARGYSLKQGKLVNIMRTWDYEIPSFYGVFSNAEDLIKWNRILESDLILNEQSRSFLFTKGKFNNGSRFGYGGGWEINLINGTKIISHSGVTGTIMVRVPDQNFCLVLLTNLGYNGNDRVDPWSLSTQIIAHYGIETKINKKHITSEGYKVIAYNKKKGDEISGRYKTKEGIEAQVIVENNTPFFYYDGHNYELALLENDTWLVLGMEYEYILSYDKRLGGLLSNLGRKYIKQ